MRHEPSGDIPTVDLGKIPSLNGFQLLFWLGFNPVNRLIFAAVIIRLGMSDSDFLRFLDDFRL
jgi:hypothetical protein